MNRLGKDEYFLEIAKLVAKRATCPRRAVGCVLVDGKNHIKATGYNGVPSGFEHCIDNPCPGAKYAGDHSKVSLCMAVHAEVNAFMQLDNFESAKVAYMTVTPCPECAKIFASSSIRKIIALDIYNVKMASEILSKAGINLEIYGSDAETYWDI